MEIIVKKDLVFDDKYNIKPIGKIDTVTAVEFGTTVNDAIDDYSINHLTLDFSEVAYVSSMGLRVLLELVKKMNSKGSFNIINTPDSVKEVFVITGFDKIIQIS